VIERGVLLTSCLRRLTKAHRRGSQALLASDVVLCTDSGKALGAAAREMGIAHRPINLAAGIRVVAKVYHVQNVNAYIAGLKLGSADSMAWLLITFPVILVAQID